ncbi:MAG: hypothetical protein DRJ52_09585 [Thermoprotei archaeon]|nr:MAG: hypothetical protein DRJ52_09585 [Thermoprotei archaeon]
MAVDSVKDERNKEQCRNSFQVIHVSLPDYVVGFFQVRFGDVNCRLDVGFVDVAQIAKYHVEKSE